MSLALASIGRVLQALKAFDDIIENFAAIRMPNRSRVGQNETSRTAGYNLVKCRDGSQRTDNGRLEFDRQGVADRRNMHKTQIADGIGNDVERVCFGTQPPFKECGLSRPRLPRVVEYDSQRVGANHDQLPPLGVIVTLNPSSNGRMFIVNQK